MDANVDVAWVVVIRVVVGVVVGLVTRFVVGEVVGFVVTRVVVGVVMIRVVAFDVVWCFVDITVDDGDVVVDVTTVVMPHFAKQPL